LNELPSRFEPKGNVVLKHVLFVSLVAACSGPASSRAPKPATTPPAGAAPTSGTVSGYDFTGFHTDPALPPGHGCPLIATLVSDTCLKSQGKTIFTRDCKILCSVPITAPAKEGEGCGGTTVAPAVPRSCASGLVCKNEAGDPTFPGTCVKQ
jgi:hypothetical protein